MDIASIEQQDYPNEPGKRGIDFSKLRSGEIITASGAKLKAEYGYGFISLKDGTHELTAEVGDNGELSLRTFTKDRKTEVKHPDMYATKFVEVALSHFEKQGIEMMTFKDRWNEGTDKYGQFHRVLKETGSKVDAALSNSYQPLRERGFTHVKEESILIMDFTKSNSQQPSFVVVKFEKENGLGNHNDHEFSTS